jgi:hypothetical protein
MNQQNCVGVRFCQGGKEMQIPGRENGGSISDAANSGTIGTAKG